MSRSLLHDWEPRIENLSVEMSKIAKDIYNTAYARGKNHSDVTEVLDKIRAEIDRQQKWLLQAGYTAYNVDIALDAIKAVVAESEEQA